MTPDNPDTVSRVVGRQVRAVRESLRPRVTQAELAERLHALGVDMHQSAIARLEAGERRVTVDDLFAIAVALNVNPRWLLSGEYTGESMPVTPGGEVPPNAMGLWIEGNRPLPGTDERTYFEFVPDDERIARLRRGVQHMRRSYLDYIEALKSDDRGAQYDALKDLRRELERQQDGLEREKRLATRNREEN